MQRHVQPETLASYMLGPAQLADLALVAAEEQGSVLDHLRVLRSTLFGFMDKAARAGDTASVTALSTAILRVLRQLGNATGEITQAANSVINIHNSTTVLTSPPFLELQAGLIEVCRAHPEARASILALCERLDAKYSPAANSGPSTPAPTMIDVTPTGRAAHAG